MQRLLTVWSCVVALLAGSPQIRAIDGTALRPFEPSSIANVMLFVTTDCPNSNSYAPEIQRICKVYAARGIACSLIYEESGLAEDAVRKHLQAYRYSGIPAAIDADGSLASRVGATITPEAVVVDRSGTTRYRGRIDNFYTGLGRSRRVVTAHDLQNALDALVAGKPVPAPETEAIGCFIVPPELRRK
jgi:hypothetical protein